MSNSEALLKLSEKIENMRLDILFYPENYDIDDGVDGKQFCHYDLALSYLSLAQTHFKLASLE